MNEIIIKKEQLNKLKEKYLKRLIIIDNDLVKLDKDLEKFNELEIINTLSLNSKQQEIVNSTDKNILCLACAGSGKTHTLISRYVNLILNKNVESQSVLLITFTKKAGQEMLNRLETIIPNKLPYHTGSIHSLAFKILQKYTNINYTIIDEIDSKKLLEIETNIFLDNNKNLNNDKKLNNDEINLIKKNIYSIIDKSTNYYPINLKLILNKFNMEKYFNFINKIYKIFIKKKKIEKIIDFNDLMILFCNFLSTDKSNEFKNQIKYIFFDEYQDVNPIQNYILSLFKNQSNIMVVGDDAQSIYSFRGSSIQCILDFPNNFLPNKKYILDINYRSTPAIVNYCQNIIKKNINQYEKNIRSSQIEYGINPNIKKFKSYEEQYLWIINDIKNKNYSDIVILARKNESLDKIEILLHNNNIPVLKLAGQSLLERPYIKDFIAFIIILYNNKSSIHWKRILSLLYNINNLNDILNKSNNIYQTLLELSNEKIEIKKLFDIIKIINNTYADLNKALIIIKYLEKLWLNKYNDNYKKDLNIIILYLKNHPCSLKELIEKLFLNTNLISTNNEEICLSTIHGSKGLEWSNVYIIDVNSNDFPNIKHQIDIEEERRLFYVACSRAKKYLTITYHGTMSVLLH